jgi:hypothetical protein
VNPGLSFVGALGSPSTDTSGDEEMAKCKETEATRIVRQFLRETGLSQHKAAQLLKMSQSWLSACLTGRVARVRPEIEDRMVKVLAELEVLQWSPPADWQEDDDQGFPSLPFELPSRPVALDFKAPCRCYELGGFVQGWG